MALTQRFDERKAVEVVLYIAQRMPDMYSTLKALYFADKLHLSRYGRTICGDSYAALDFGPVPSGTYDIVKYARGDGWYSTIPDYVTAAFEVSVATNLIIPHRPPNTDVLSASDMMCLDETIEELRHLPFAEIKRLGHQEEAYKATERNKLIPLEAIIRELPDNGDLLLDYLESM